VERGLVRVVLERDEVEAQLVGEPGEQHGPLGRVVDRGDERAEAEVVAVVGHALSLPRRISARSGRCATYFW
jgi:hypothetical protein